MPLGKNDDQSAHDVGGRIIWGLKGLADKGVPGNKLNRRGCVKTNGRSSHVPSERPGSDQRRSDRTNLHGNDQNRGRVGGRNDLGEARRYSILGEEMTGTKREL